LAYLGEMGTTNTLHAST